MFHVEHREVRVHMPGWLSVDTVQGGLQLAMLVGAPFLARWMRQPKVHERAEALDRIARGAAALAVSLQPNSSWASRLATTIEQVERAAGLPTKNPAAIERAATLALTEIGAGPPAVPVQVAPR